MSFYSFSLLFIVKEFSEIAHTGLRVTCTARLSLDVAGLANHMHGWLLSKEQVKE